MKKITTLAFLSMAALSINAAEYLDISPNPTSDILTVNTEANKMEVYGLNGVLAIEAAGNQINVSSLAKGIYVVRIYTNDGFITKTFIKE